MTSKRKAVRFETPSITPVTVKHPKPITKQLGKKLNQLVRREIAPQALPEFAPSWRYRGLQGKVVESVEHKFEEGFLYIHVRFADKTELSWRIRARSTIEEADLADWTSGDFKQLKVFVKNGRDRSL